MREAFEAQRKLDTQRQVERERTLKELAKVQPKPTMPNTNERWK